VIADRQLGSLLDFKYKRTTRPSARDGRNKDQYGARGPDLVIRVPIGTVIYADDAPLVDSRHRGRASSCSRGAASAARATSTSKSPWNQAPHTAEPGTPAKECTVRLSSSCSRTSVLLGYPNVASRR